MRVTYRQIAKMFASALPTFDGQNFSTKVDEYSKAIEALPIESQLALKAAYIFSHTRQVPNTEREEVFQDLALAVEEKHTTQEALAYAVARNRWKTWLEQRRIRRTILNGGFIRLNRKVYQSKPIELHELIIGDGESTARIESEVNAQRIFNSLPDKIKPLVEKRLQGNTLTGKEYMALRRFAQKEGDKIRALATS